MALMASDPGIESGSAKISKLQPMIIISRANDEPGLRAALDGKLDVQCLQVPASTLAGLSR